MKKIELYKKVLPKGVLFHPYLKRLLIMFNWSLILTFLLCTQVYAVSYPQTSRVDLNLKSTSLKKALSVLEQRGNIRLLYSEEFLPEKEVSLISKDIPVLDALSEILKDTNLNYRVFGDGLVVIISPQGVIVQDIIVRGKVSDEQGEPLIGVSVKLKGTSQGVATDLDGNFTITIPGQNSILEFTYISFVRKEIVVGNNTTLNVVLQPDVQALSEVVVVGYGTMDKKEVTSSISHVSGDELATVGSNDPLMKLQGKVAGLTIQNTGASDPNSTAGIQLRGATTRSTADAATGPLIVIDGVPGGNLLSVNENDIASIDILKDGAASAIYGTRASNGVILITTKRGVGGDPTLSYNGFASIDMPTMTLKPLTSTEWREIGRGTDYGYDTNWMDEITNDFASTHKHTISISGGSDRTTYRGTVDYQDSKGLDIRSNRQQYGARLNINHTSKSGLYDIILNVAPRFVKRNDANRDAFTQALNLNPTMPVMNPDNPAAYYEPGGFVEYNPVEQLKLQEVGRESKSLDWNGTFKLNPFPNFNTQVQLAQVSSDDFQFEFSPSTMTTQIKNGNKGTASREYSKRDQYSFEWLANYSLNLNKHSFRFLGVYSYQYFVNSGLNANNRDFSSDALSYNNLDNGTYNLVAGRNGFGTNKSDNKLISFRARVNYSYEDKYMMTASLTRDGSSRFGENNKWGYFPGVSLGWRLSSEPFLKDVSWLSDLKLRGDYGETGNQEALGNYASLARYQGFSQYMYEGSYIQVWGPSNNVNPDLKWEKLKNWNIGLDFSLFQNKVGGSFNYYSRRAVDLLGSYNAPMPPNIVTTTVANVGEMTSNGLEIELTAKLVDRDDFSYNVSFNGATLNSVFKSFSNDLYQGQSFVDQLNMPAPGSPGTIQRLQEGKRLGMFYFWKYAGVDDDGNIMIYNKAGDAVPASAATQDDKDFVGNGQPKFVAGMTHAIRYKKWDASASLRGNFGYDIFNVHEFYYALQAAAQNANVLPEAYTRNAHIKGEKLLVDYFLEKGDFLKLDVVTLGYTFDFKKINSVRLYASTRNLLTFTKFQGIDPDLYPINGQNPGVVNNQRYYPSTTQFLMGLQVTF